MATNRELITGAFRKIGIGSPSAGDVDDALVELRDMIFEWERNDIDLLYLDTSGLDDETDIPRGFNSAVTILLAQRLGGTYDINLNPVLQRQASLATQTLHKNTVELQEWTHPNRMPRGSGNTKRAFGRYRRYYREDQSDRRNLVSTNGDTLSQVSTEGE